METTIMNLATAQGQKFRNRFEQVDYYAKQRGWKPLTPDEKKELDEAIRMVTNLD